MVSRPDVKLSKCRDCGRDIEIRQLEDGSRIVTDTEERSAILSPGGLEVVKVRLLHASVCAPREVTARAKAHAERVAREKAAGRGGSGGFNY